ncbi:hypothetical protein pb186bvf_011384 [Paramecium bursaria]
MFMLDTNIDKGLLMNSETDITMLEIKFQLKLILPLKKNKYQKKKIIQKQSTMRLRQNKRSPHTSARLTKMKFLFPIHIQKLQKKQLGNIRGVIKEYLFYTFEQLINIQNIVVFLRSDWINKSFQLPNKQITRLVESNLTTYKIELMYSSGCQDLLFQFKYAMLNCLKEMTLTKKNELLKEELSQKQKRLIQLLQNRLWCRQYFQN